LASTAGAAQCSVGGDVRLHQRFPFLLPDGFGLSAQQFSLCFAVNALGIIGFTVTGRVLLRRYRPARLLVVSLAQAGLGAIVLLAAVVAGWGLRPVLAGLFVMLSAVGLALPNSAALAMDLHRPIAGAAAGVFGLAQYATGARVRPSSSASATGPSEQRWPSPRCWLSRWVGPGPPSPDDECRTRTMSIPKTDDTTGGRR
jgi:hypothetical protein